MADITDLGGRRNRRRETGTRRTFGDSDKNHRPTWISKFVIPHDACEPCSRHWHHKCDGVNVLLDPVPDCPCDCGTRKDPMLLNPKAWADLAVHCPEEVWRAALLQHLHDRGGHMCAWRDDDSGLRSAK